LAALVTVLSAQSGSPERLDPPEAYENQARLPVDLYTNDGVLIPEGSYRLTVEFNEEQPSLAFITEDGARTEVKGLTAAARDPNAMPTVPIVGALFLRSTRDPVGTDAERHHSKTGAPQYHETTRDWKAALRMYRYADKGRKEVLVVFQRRQRRGLWEASEFELFLERP
jgi:hypothetical protein